MKPTLGLYRPHTYNRKILIVDGISGSGKTLILQALKNIYSLEQTSFENGVECYCHLYHEGITSAADTAALIQQRLDVQYYNVRISREVNLRPKDLTGITFTRKFFRVLRRMFQQDGPNSDVNLNDRSTIQSIAVHHTPEIVEIMRGTGVEIYYLRMLRHPCFLFHNNLSFIESFGQTPRDFTLMRKLQGGQCPIFIKDCEAYLRMNSHEKTATLISDLYDREQAYPVEVGSHREIEVIFENFVSSPSDYSFEFLSPDEKLRFRSALSKLDVPRANPQAFRSNSVYSRYGQTPQNNSTDIKLELSKITNFVRENTSEYIFNRFRETCQSYESRYWCP